MSLPLEVLVGLGLLVFAAVLFSISFFSPIAAGCRSDSPAVSRFSPWSIAPMGRSAVVRPVLRIDFVRAFLLALCRDFVQRTGR